MKLNLGCGKKFIKGWTGMDARDYGQEYVGDLQKLPFDDESIDAIMAIHVLEHFYQWDAEDVLREWIRVLKFGCELIIEVPDFGLALQRSVNGIDDPQLTWWVIYGDPAHRDPLMCHHWGWTRPTVQNLMLKCGLSEIRQEDARFKLKDRRDIRIVGVKCK